MSLSDWHVEKGYRDFSDLVGKTIKSVTGLEKDNDTIVFACGDGTKYLMFHDQDCCESVYIADIDGDESDLIGGLVIDAREEVGGDDNVSEDLFLNDSDSYTWTFYHLQTTKGSVVIRWLGTSNGYYSESVDFKLIK
jgi:hypothetical protein